MASIKHRVAALANKTDGSELNQLWQSTLTDLTNALDRLHSQTLGSAGLRIKGGSASPMANAQNAFYASANGVLVKTAANTDMPALSGTVTNAKFNVFCFFIDSAGTVTSAMGTEGATLAAVTWPTFPANKACIGFVVINPTGTGNFVGNTTNLDDATVVPNAAFVNTQGAFDPISALSLIA